MALDALETIDTLTPQKLAKLCDHTFLKRPESYRLEAIQGESPVKLREKDFWKFLEMTLHSKALPYAICIRPEDVSHAKKILDRHKNTPIKIVSVAGFPDGSWTPTKFKIFEAKSALDDGADEIDAVIPYLALKKGDHNFVLNEMKQLTDLVHHYGKKIKWIIETSELSSNEIVQICSLATHAGADFIKTSTGFSAHGANIDQIHLIASNFAGGIKISGGVSMQNVYALLGAACFKTQGKLRVDPLKLRIGESGLLQQLSAFVSQKA